MSTASIVKKNAYPGILFLALPALIVLMPALFIPLPPLLDYPNHLARLWLICGGAATPPLDRFYAVDWHGIATNIGIDLAAKAFCPIVPPLRLGRILLALAIVLPPLGAALLNRAVFHRWSIWQTLFFFFWSSQTLLDGFLNFQIGLGMALMAAALDQSWSPPPAVRFLIRLTIAVALIVIHPFALLFYFVLLAGLGFGPEPFDFRNDRTALRLRLSAAIRRAAVCLIPVIVFFALPNVVPGGNAMDPIEFNGPISAILALFTPFFSYNVFVDIVFLEALFALAIIWATKKKIRIHGGLFAASIGTAIAALFMPCFCFNTYLTDQRLPLMAVMTGFSAICLTPSADRRETGWQTAGICSLVLLRTLWIGWNWSAGPAMVASMQKALKDVPAGATLLTVKNYHLPPLGFAPLGRNLIYAGDTYRHYPAMAVVWRHAYVPTLFSQPGKQPIHVRPPYTSISNPTGGVLASVHATALWKTNCHSRQPGKKNQSIKCPPRFEYLLVLNADQPDRYGPFVPPANLHLVNAAGFARLYRIDEDVPKTELQNSKTTR